MYANILMSDTGADHYGHPYMIPGKCHHEVLLQGGWGARPIRHFGIAHNAQRFYTPPFA
jgi:hypothetical protein